MLIKVVKVVDEFEVASEEAGSSSRSQTHTLLVAKRDHFSKQQSDVLVKMITPRRQI